MKTPQRRPPSRKATPRQSPAAEAAPPQARPGPLRVGRGSPARRRQRRTIRYVLVEIVIVSIGVLLALGVDAARRSVQDRQRAAEIRAAFRDEMTTNRERVQRKMDRVSWAYRITARNPERAPEWVLQPRGNLLVLFFDTAWQDAVTTDGLRLLRDDERAALSELYASQAALLAREEAEMALWDDLVRYPAGAAATPEEARHRDAQLRRWRLAAQRLHHHACRQLMRIKAGLAERRLRLDSTERCEATDPAGAPLRRSPDAGPA